MRVLILGKTHMLTGTCIGGLLLESNRSVRLIPEGRNNNPQDTDYGVGQIWDIVFHESDHIEPPHTEDIIVTRGAFIANQPNVRDLLIHQVNPYRGAPEGLYGGMVGFTGNGSAYIASRLGIPGQSTCFWIPDRQLDRRISGRTTYYYYVYPDGREVRFPFVGFQESVPVLNARTLIRLSLARWWTPDDNPDFESRCYVQLSGWFI